MGKNITYYWVGLDVHADKIQVAVYRDFEMSSCEEYGSGTDTRSMERLLQRLQDLPGKVHCVYEAGPCGYELQRYLTVNGIHCEIAAPALIPKRAGDRVKTDRRDARNLGRLYRSGELTLIHIPDAEHEAVRDLVRARETAVEDVTRKRHQLSKFLLRHGHRYRSGKQWTEGHTKWMKKIQFTNATLKSVFEEYVLTLDQAEERVKRLTQSIETLAQTPEYQKPVAALMTLRGVKTITAMTIVSEIGDMRRFGKAKDFMSALGLVPSEYSSGKNICRGGITKTGNAHVRRVLVESAWHYRHRPTVGKAIKARRKGQALEIVSVAQKADVRLCRKFRGMVERGKRTTVAAVATARELAGFIWAIGQKIHS
jgi:transposase